MFVEHQQFRVPLHADEKTFVGTLMRLNETAPVVARHNDSVANLIHGLMVKAVHPNFIAANDFPHLGSGLQGHDFACENGADIGLFTRHAPNVHIQCTIVINVHNLRPPANAKNR